MGEIQLWQVDGLGTDKSTLEKVIRIFRGDGVQGIQSQQALTQYIRKMSDSTLREMYAIDKETTLQIWVDCFGAAAAFENYAKAGGFTTRQKADKAGWISLADHTEVIGKYEERMKTLDKEKDRILSDYTYAVQKAEDAAEEIVRLRNELAHYKADLYDFYAQAGKLPNYERG